jgi:cystathionine beta-lyase/cystathionine gamma-synthase
MVWVETPTNPMLKLADLRAIAASAATGHHRVADNTFASPWSSARWSWASTSWCTRPPST